VVARQKAHYFTAPWYQRECWSQSASITSIGLCFGQFPKGAR
jgi:hypothetical protein